MRNKLKNLLKIINVSIEKAERFAHESKKAANEIARAAAASPSQSGDREHARGQAIIYEQNLTKLNLLKQEIEVALNKEVPTKVEVPCFIEVEFDDGATESLFLVDNPVNVKGEKLISNLSPLGKSLVGKTPSESFSYKLGESDVRIQRSGKILSIE